MAETHLTVESRKGNILHHFVLENHFCGTKIGFEMISQCILCYVFLHRAYNGIVYMGALCKPIFLQKQQSFTKWG